MQKGFTLIEFLIVICVIAILAIPAWQQYQSPQGTSDALVTKNLSLGIKTTCVNGVSVMVDGNGIATQLIDPNGNPLACNQNQPQ